jgi:predicted secreted Zn-dependent protease
VAITVDNQGLTWRTASRCSPNGCVQVAAEPDGSIAVRDSKDPLSPVLRYTHDEWDLFITGVKDGEFDRTRLQTSSHAPALAGNRPAR